MDAITIKHLDVVFGDKPASALELLDQGKSRQDIIDETGQIVGVAYIHNYLGNAQWVANYLRRYLWIYRKVHR